MSKSVACPTCGQTLPEPEGRHICSTCSLRIGKHPRWRILSDGRLRVALLCLLLTSGISIVWGFAMERGANGGLVDFKAIYYGARCLIHHSDPYKESEFLRIYRAEGGEFPPDPAIARLFLRAVPVCINLPTALFIVAPFALLPWGPAHVLWMILVGGGLTFAASLIWDLGKDYSPGVSLFLICIVLANSEVLFALGNAAGIAIGLCIIAIWCFFKNRWAPAGVVCLAVSLAIKPHDAGLVWLYLILAGGAYRKRGLQTLAVASALGLAAVLWVSSVAPGWMQELHSNVVRESAHGGLNDAGPASISSRSADMVVDLQAAVSVFRDDPRVYNPVSYLVCGALLIAWSASTLRSRLLPNRTWFALAAIAAISLLPVYHREHDAKLLLLTIPACAILWTEGGLLRWTALLLNTAGIVMTGDLPSAALMILTRGLHIHAAGVPGLALTVILLRPCTLLLLAIGTFYLWVYMRRVTADRFLRPGWKVPRTLGGSRPSLNRGCVEGGPAGGYAFSVPACAAIEFPSAGITCSLQMVQNALIPARAVPSSSTESPSIPAESSRTEQRPARRRSARRSIL